MALPTPLELVDRLKEVYGVRTDEDLARRLGVPVRSVGRWKAGKAMNYARTVDFLNRCGWLSTMKKVPAADHIRLAEEAAAAAAEEAENLKRRSQGGRAPGA